MSLLSALYTGVSGLQSFGNSLQVIGDNIANVNTTAFKSNRAEFSDLLSQTITSGGAGHAQMGRGVQMSNVSTSFEQGSLSNTDRLTDLAINGSGFFIVQTESRNYYTRNGQFTLNASGELVTTDGHNLLGYQYDPTGEPLGTIGPVQIANTSISPQITTEISISANLDSRIDEPFDPLNPPPPFDVNDAVGTSDFSTVINVYDSLGNSHELHVYFNKTSTNNWEWHGVMDGAELDPTLALTGPQEVAGGTLAFNANGALQTETTTSSSFNFTGTPQTIEFDFGEAIDDSGTGLEGTTQFSNNNTVTAQNQNGLSAGNLASVTVNSEGIVSGVYTNGRMLPIGQIALANFANLQGLFKVGGGLYQDTVDSGDPVVNEPGIGEMGVITSYTLELSNVDLATEFVNLIATQRGYQANSKIISVGQELLNEMIQIIR